VPLLKVKLRVKVNGPDVEGVWLEKAVRLPVAPVPAQTVVVGDKHLVVNHVLLVEGEAELLVFIEKDNVAYKSGDLAKRVAKYEGLGFRQVKMDG
jgi:hypothetical protein